MTRWNLRARIDALFEALERHPAVDVLVARRGAPVAETEIAAIEAELGWTLEPRFLDFFRIHDGVRLVWIDSRHELPDVEADAAPWLHFEAAEREHGGAGSINIRSLRETLLDPWPTLSSYEPGEHVLESLGGWDLTAFELRLRVFDDLFDDQHFGSYYLPAIVLDPIYPHPPVMIGDDHSVGDDSHPILAADYVDHAIATLGRWSDKRALLGIYQNRGVTEGLLLPPDAWLDDFPSATDVLDVYLGAADPQVEARLERLRKTTGRPVAETRWASYVDRTAEPPSKALPPDLAPFLDLSLAESALAGHDARSQKVVDALPLGFRLQMPRLASDHYRADAPFEPSLLRALKLLKLVGHAVKMTRRSWGESVGCLVSVEPDGVWIYRASYHRTHDGTLRKSSWGFNHTPFGEIESIGRAVPTV